MHRRVTALLGVLVVVLALGVATGRESDEPARSVRPTGAPDDPGFSAAGDDPPGTGAAAPFRAFAAAGPAPAFDDQVDVSGVAVLWRHRVCDFAVRMLIDQDGEIAAVAVDAAG